jgi:hypothetical protein
MQLRDGLLARPRSHGHERGEVDRPRVRSTDAANRGHPPANRYEEPWERYSLLAAYFRVAPWFSEDVDDSNGSELYDGDLDDYLDHDGERDLIAAEPDDYAPVVGRRRRGGLVLRRQRRGERSLGR